MDNLPEKSKETEVIVSRVDNKDYTKFQPNVPWKKVNERVYNKTCVLCNSTYRDEAETMYEECGNVRRVYKFLTEQRMIEFSYQACANHFRAHYNAMHNERMVQEYAEQLEDWLVIQGDQIAGLIRAMAMIEKELMLLQAMNDGLPLPERRKNNDIIVKMSSLLLSYRSKLADLEKEKEPVTYIINQLKFILKDEIKDSSTKEEKDLAKRILVRLKNACDDIFKD